MEIVDIYNERHEKLEYTKERQALEKGEYRLSCFVFTLNDKDELLIQQRTQTAKHCPNMWEVTSGGAIAGDDAVEGAIRELKEELNIEVKKEELKFIGNYVRVNDYVEVFLLKKNIKIEDLTLQKEEVQDVKWETISEFEKLIKEEKACSTGFNIFKNYYDNFYKIDK